MPELIAYLKKFSWPLIEADFKKNVKPLLGNIERVGANCASGVCLITCADEQVRWASAGLGG